MTEAKGRSGLQFIVIVIVLLAHLGRILAFFHFQTCENFQFLTKSIIKYLSCEAVVFGSHSEYEHVRMFFRILHPIVLEGAPWRAGCNEEEDEEET